MSVESFIELYMTIFGWIMYDGLWGTLTDTGIAYLPFIGAVAKSFSEPYQSQNERDASVTSLKRVEVAVFTMLTVVVLAVQPAIPLSQTELRYTPRCEGSTVTGGNTGTTYDNVFTETSLGGQTARVPVWWMGILRISAGVTAAGLQTIPCGTDFRQVKFDADNIRVKDPQTRKQLGRFYQDCWSHAKARFDRLNDTVPDDLPPQDIYWPGSRYFQQNGNYYRLDQPGVGIPGFPWNEDRDSAYNNPDLPPPKWGHPTCDQWWSDPQHGLRTRLLDEADTGVMNRLATIFNGYGVSARDAEDLAIRNLINSERVFGDIGNGQARGLADVGSSIAAAIGLKFEQAVLLPKVYLLQQAAPIAQATILMILYAALPLVLVFSSYSISVVITTSIIIFAIKFLSVFWAMARWMDTHLQEAIVIAQGQGDPLDRFFDFLIGNPIDSPGKDVLDLTLAVLFVIVPVIWVFALGLGGIQAGNAIGRLVSAATEPAASAGEKGGKEATDASKRGIRRGAGTKK